LKGEEGMKNLIKEKRAVIVAADVISIEALEELIKETHEVKGIGGYKIGAILAMRYGLVQIVNTIRRYTSLPIIYDHQKAGTDIPQLGEKFAEVIAESGVDAVILFPFGGAATEREWIRACQDAGLMVLVGGHMTQKEFLASEGGFIADGAPAKIYEIATRFKVRDFVVPGNKIEFVQLYRKLLEKKLGKGNFALWAPGFIREGGVITEYALAAGPIWRAIVGSAIYKAKDKRKAAEIITSNL
jgi:orotidine-5'-phosphate decarboxylase